MAAGRERFTSGHVQLAAGGWRWTCGLPAARRRVNEALGAERSWHLVSPGDTITTDTGFMRCGPTAGVVVLNPSLCPMGCYSVRSCCDWSVRVPRVIMSVLQGPTEPYMEEDKLLASVAGVVERVNKLICVRALKTRYNGEVGDIVVGRITECGSVCSVPLAVTLRCSSGRWKVDTLSRLDSVLLLSSVNLPGGELAEVQAVYSDGALSLHTRSLKYGKVRMSPVFVSRTGCPGASVTIADKEAQDSLPQILPCGASIILGNNGYNLALTPPRNRWRRKQGASSPIWSRSHSLTGGDLSPEELYPGSELAEDAPVRHQHPVLLRSVAALPGEYLIKDLLKMR
ncbi:unnamed protein product [Ranitomeya imitator]|uniref:RRP4 S1 domain-containing protein n=1 Tax=Ranitomeya imitator TaxID=111125 RepID=A0ABN9LHB8_9NEOB|nr:unnamed protein product [Ranitomeya imitator]